VLLAYSRTGDVTECDVSLIGDDAHLVALGVQRGEGESRQASHQGA
jgi:hypothetical protein